MHYSRSLLSAQDLREINNIIPHLEWQDGLGTTPNMSSTAKNNLEAIPTDAYNAIGNIIANAFDRDKEFHIRTTNKAYKNLLITKTVVGGYYRAHQDNWTIGDYSSTIFLNSGYEGGELCVDEAEYKLPVGHAVTYPTGSPHLVNEVTKGERIVAVFWTESLFKDPGVRSIASDMCRAMNILGQSEPSCLLEAKNDPSFLVSNAFMNLKRRYGVQ